MKDLKWRRTTSRSRDKEKSEIDSDNRDLKIRQRLAAHSGRRNSILQRSQTFRIDPLLCVLWLSSVIFSSHLSYHVTHYALMVTRSTFMDHLWNNNLRRSPHFGDDPLKSSKWPWGRVCSTCPLEFLVSLLIRKPFLTRHGWATFPGYAKTPEGKEGEKGEEKAGEVW